MLSALFRFVSMGQIRGIRVCPSKKLQHGGVLALALSIFIVFCTATVFATRVPENAKTRIADQSAQAPAVVKNGKTPAPTAGGANRFSLEPLWSVGGSASPDQDFSDISSVAVDPEGAVFVLDTKESHVLVFDAAGKFVRAFGRKGQGHLYLGTATGYRIQSYDFEGKLTRIVEREYDPVPLTKEYRDMLAKMFAGAGKEYFYDLFDAAGRYVARFPSAAEFLLWRNGRIYGAEENEDGYKILKCFRVIG